VRPPALWRRSLFFPAKPMPQRWALLVDRRRVNAEGDGEVWVQRNKSPLKIAVVGGKFATEPAEPHPIS
jgi:hypothetical protein